MRTSKAVQQAKLVTPQGGRILEISCGSGKVLQALQQAGYQTVGTNYSRYENEPDGLDIRHGVDLLQGLPFPDADFDTVMLLDVIEHVADHDRVIAELARVCKPGGHILILTPNIMKIASRLDFLWTGFFKLKRAFIGFDVPPETAFTFHNHPVHIPVFLYQLQARGLALLDWRAAGFKPKSLIWYGLLGPMIALATWLKLRFGEKNIRKTPAANHLRRILTSRDALCGEFILFTARKTEQSPTSSCADSATALPDWSKKW